jgi:regulator of protease activity HflC (stomatin/prohibitin superfamily)
VEQPEDTSANSKAVAVSQLRVAVRIQYQILDAYQWINTYANPETALTALADREVMRYCASVDVKGMLGPDHGRVEQALWKTIQSKADEANLGVKIVFLGLLGIHPPEETAEDFQKVVGAEQKRAATISGAWEDYNRKLAEVAGGELLPEGGEVRGVEILDDVLGSDVDPGGRRRAMLAEALVHSIRRVNKLESDPVASPDELQEARDRLEDLFLGGDGSAGIGGQAAGILARGRAGRWQHENKAHAQHVTFIEEMKVQNAAPGIYRIRKYLEALEGTVGEIRKYVVSMDSSEAASMILDLRESLTMPLGEGPQE